MTEPFINFAAEFKQTVNMKHRTFLTLFLLMVTFTAFCQTGTLAVRGADISWCSEMESQGVKFYDTSGNETDIFALMKQIGMNTVRLRVWVAPEGGYGAWCNKADVLAKARRAQAQGLDLLIDFHYSDYFADPGRQTKPAEWAGMTVDELKTAIAEHTKDVLQALKDEGITPKWVQVGNETNNGMVWPEGRIDWNASGMKRWGGYVALSNAGYSAVKEVLPDAKVMVHFPNAKDDATTSFREFKTCGGKFDAIGLSHYPGWDTWSNDNTSACENAKKLSNLFHVPIMFVETGYSNWDEQRAESVMKDLFAKAVDAACIDGILYWEPQVYGGWNARLLQDDGTWKEGKSCTLGRKVSSNGAFTAWGRPAAALLVFGQGATASIQNVDISSKAPIHYYNIKGQSVSPHAKGFVITRQGNITTKTLLR